MCFDEALPQNLFLYPLFGPLFWRPWIHNGLKLKKPQYILMSFTKVWKIKVFVWCLKFWRKYSFNCKFIANGDHCTTSLTHTRSHFIQKPCHQSYKKTLNVKLTFFIFHWLETERCHTNPMDLYMYTYI